MSRPLRLAEGAARRALGLAQGLARALLTLVLLAAAPTAAPTAALAHAVMLSTEPSDGALLAVPPAAIEIRFNEPVSVIRAQVLGPDGRDALVSDGLSQDGTLRLPLQSDLPEGTYVASYRVVSLDGHPVAGSLVFSVGAASSPPAGAARGDSTAQWRAAFVLTWTGFCLGLLSAAGGAIYLALVRPTGLSRWGAERAVTKAAALGLVFAGLAVGAQGGLLYGATAADLLTAAPWAAGLASTFGRTALVAAVGLALVVVAMTQWVRWATTPLALLAVALGLGSFALSGHVVTAASRGLTVPLLLAHVIPVAFWVGSLVPLRWALRAPPVEANLLVARFSRVALVAVPVLAAAGLGIAALQIERLEALVATPYGRLVLVKVALVGGLVGLAALNRLWLTPALVRGEARAPERLSRSILVEGLLVGAIVALTGALSTTPPPRALGTSVPLDDHHAHAEHGHAHGGLSLSLALGDLTAQVALEPGGVGPNTASIQITDAAGQPLEPLEVTLRLSSPALGIEPFERAAERTGPGAWRADDVVIGAAGVWRVDLDVLVTDFERARGSAEEVIR